MTEEVIAQLQKLMGPEFQVEYVSRLRGYVVFRADERYVSDDQISQLIARLLSNGYFPRIQRQYGNLFVHVVPQKVADKPARIWINVLLFLLTIFSTMMAGAIMLQKDFFSDFSLILAGWPYSLAVMLILTAHEMGHYLAARYHKLKVTLPYYIPLPIPAFHFGTLGAFIKIKSPIPSRLALLDVGAAGPISGFVVSIIFLVIGYANLPDLPGIIAYVEQMHPWDVHDQGINLVLGKSLLFAFFNDVLAGGRLPMNEVYHFPFIFAGWIGFLVTALNLIPIGQLDGGHILYALFRKKARLAGMISFLLLLILNFVLIIRFFSFVWVLWIILILFLIGFRHPPTMQDDPPLNFTRRVIGWITLSIFILCFTPLPIYIQ
ncbi:MAG: site-2 protease family protein [Calditrichia bacterium]